MGIRNLVNFVLGRGSEVAEVDCSDIVLRTEIAYKKLYVNSAIDLIARSLIACDFESYREGKKKRAENYYQLNIAPNRNENAHEFWYKVIHNLVYHNEALIIPMGEELWIAESFHRETTNGLKEYIYKSVSVNNQILMQDFKERDVLYLRLSEDSINNVIDSLYNSYGLLLSKALSDYRGNGRLRYLFKGRFMNSLTDKEGEASKALFEEKMKDYMNPEKVASVLFLPENVTMEDQSATPRNLDTRDVKNLAKDMLDFVATAFHIPSSLLSGETTSGDNLEADLDNFILFAVRPIGDMIANEYNKKIFDKQDFIKKTYVKFSMENFKLFDMSKYATAVDKLFAVGGLSINDVIERLGLETIEEDWANERFVTKNYERARLTGTSQGGDLTNGENTTQIPDGGKTTGE